MRVNQKSLLVIAIGFAMFFGFGLAGIGYGSLLGWIVGAAGVGWYVYEWVRRYRKQGP